MFMLRDLRKAKGLTMKELGDLIGVAESTISQYETGKREPDFETLLKFGEMFDVSVDYLLRGELYSGRVKRDQTAADAATASDATRFTSEEIDHIKKYRGLDGHGKDMVDTVTDKEATRSTHDENEA
jgi:transcriptional regulator with XRE-family HTH domain